MASQAELQLILSALDRASAQIKRVAGGVEDFGVKATKGQKGADAFNRATTRSTAALGLLSPQAAMATAQITALTNVTGLLTIALGALAVGGVAIIALTRNTTKAFSDQEEAANAALQVFGESQGVIEAFAADSAKSFGVSKRAAFEYTAAIGAILQTSGQTREESAKTSVEIVKLAADLASLKNLSIDVALQKIRSGLVGEAEPLRVVGVLLSEQRVKAKAAELGLADYGATLTEGQKVAARYAIIQQDLAVAQGDFARTSGGLANQQRILSARFEDSRARLGQKLLPVMLLAVTAMGLMLDGADKLGVAFGFLNDKLNITDRLNLVALALIALTIPILGPIGVIAALAFLAFRWESVFRELPGPVQSAAIAVAGIFDAMINGIVSGLNTALGAIEEFANAIGGSKIVKAINFGLGKVGAPTIPESVSLGQIGLESNIAEALKAIVRPVFGPPSPEKAQPGFPALPEQFVPPEDAAKAAKAAKEVDLLADGIIDLAEAMANGISIEQAAVLELGKEAEEFANRLFRVAVETRKLALLNEPGAIRSRALLELAEAEVEAGKRALELKTELAKLYITMIDGNTAIKGGAALLLESQVAFAQSQVELRNQLVAVQVMLGQQGLTGRAGVFRHALQNLGEGFREAGESITRFLQRLSAAALSATQQAFDSLFNRPTRETSEIQLRIAELQRTRLLRLQSGATEDELKTLDDQIAALQRNIDLKETENKILQLNAQLADKTLLTDQQQVAQAFLLIGVISQQSALVQELNNRLAFEIFAQIGATAALNEFADALREAHGVISNRPGGSFGTAGGGVQVNVALSPQLSDLGSQVLRTVNIETQKALARVGFGGVRASSGALRP